MRFASFGLLSHLRCIPFWALSVHLGFALPACTGLPPAGTDAGSEVTDAPLVPDAPPTLPDAPGTAAPDAPIATGPGIYAGILVPRCATCHSPEAARSTPWLTDAASTYDALVDVPVATAWVTTCIARWEPPLEMAYRVRPSDTRASMLAFLGDCYVRDAEHAVLSAAEADAIRTWIAAGASESEFSRP